MIRVRRTPKGPGLCARGPCLGATLADVPGEPGPRQRELAELQRSSLEPGSNYCPEAFSARRQRCAVLDASGQVYEKNRPSAEATRPESIRIVGYDPRPYVEPGGRGKRCYDWTHRPTGWENPDQWEEPPVPGQRPTHPVCAVGAVALEHKRSFPEKQLQETACPGQPRLSQAPFGSEWGGWARSGAPGRKPLLQPWDSLVPRGSTAADATEAAYRFSDAKRKPFPDMQYRDTSHLTRWHLDAKADIDPIARKMVHVNTPRQAPTSATTAALLALPPAGVRSARGPRAGSLGRLVP